MRRGRWRTIAAGPSAALSICRIVSRVFGASGAELEITEVFGAGDNEYGGVYW
jgi:hypothetical protein